MTPAPVIRAVLDTQVVIDYREAVPAAVRLFAEIRRTRFPEFSEVTALHVIARCTDAAEANGIQNFLGISTVHPISVWVSRRARAILDSHPLPIPLTADDALVAVTALIHKLPLYTLDPPRFAAVPGLSAIRPY